LNYGPKVSYVFLP